MAFKYDYSDEKRRRDSEQRNIRQIKSRLERMESYITIKGEDNLTSEQNFIIKYAGLTAEDVPKEELYIEKCDKILAMPSKLSETRLETQRYCMLINLLFMLPNSEIEFSNKVKDIFHKKITSLDAYISTFESDPLIIKKMRNLQLLNRLAHKFEKEFFEITNRMLPQFLRFEKEDRRMIQADVKDLFSPIENISEQARIRLMNVFDEGIINEIKFNSVLNVYLDFSKWMYGQKNEYTLEVLRDLEKTDGEYNYGKRITESEGKKQLVYIFDVPGYGQFSVHRIMRDPQYQELDRKIRLYREEDYLAMHNLLYKADEELISQVNIDELSNRDKKIYKIVTQKVKPKNREKYDEARKVSSGLDKEKQSFIEIKSKILALKAKKQELKTKIKENEEKLAKLLAENEQPTEEVIRSIKELQKIIEEQKREKAEIKGLKESYKEKKRNAKKTIKEGKIKLKDQIDDLEL